MKNFSILPVLFVFVCFSSTIFSQTAQPTPPLPDDKDVVKISTTLIQVDATVTDKKGNLVEDLKPENFEIYENGKKQQITNFSFVSTSPENKPVESIKASKSNSKTAIPLPPFKLKPEQVRHAYALIVDDLGLSFAGIALVRDSLKKFINEQMKEGDLVSVLRVGAGLGALQSFTSDKRQLMAAVDKIHWNMNSRTGVNSYDALNQNFGPGSNESDQEKDEDMSRDAFRQRNASTGTLVALRSVITGMNELPGRKSILFFSEGFQTCINCGDPRKAPQLIPVIEGLRLVAEMATRASIVIYTFDPRGIYVPMKEAGDDVDPNSSAAQNAVNIRQSLDADSKNSLRSLAEDTGGFAYLVNKMDYGIKKVIDDQSGYYLIGYQPDSETFDANKNRFNKLTVKINRPDMKIRYRSGFFGITDEKLKKTTETPAQQISTALVSPFGATGVNIDLYSLFYNTKASENFIRSLIWIDPKDLTFVTEPDGQHKTDVQVVAMTFGDNGVPIDQTAKSFEIKFDEEKYQAILQKGLIYDFVSPVKKPGAYQFRIALRDTVSGKIGSASQFIDVPNINKKKLALSNMIIKDYSVVDWKKISGGQSPDSQSNTAFRDTTTRQFKSGSILTYSYMIYNAKTDPAQKTQLQIQKRLFRDGSLIFETPAAALDTGEPEDMQRIGASGAISLERNWSAGDYVLQLVITDNLAKENKQIAAQSIDFEIVN